MKSHTYVEKVAQLFRRHRFQWLSAYRLMEQGGTLAWRSRVSECRTLLGMPIENRQRVKSNGVKVSEYRLGRRRAA